MSSDLNNYGRSMHQYYYFVRETLSLGFGLLLEHATGIAGRFLPVLPQGECNFLKSVMKSLKNNKIKNDVVFPRAAFELVFEKPQYQAVE